MRTFPADEDATGAVGVDADAEVEPFAAGGGAGDCKIWRPAAPVKE